MLGRDFLMEGSKLTTAIKYFAPGADGGDLVGRFKNRLMSFYNDERDFLHIRVASSKIPGNDLEYFIPLQFVELKQHFYYKYLRHEFGGRDVCYSMTSEYIYDRRPSDPNCILKPNDAFIEFRLRPIFDKDVPGQMPLSENCQAFYEELCRRKERCRNDKLQVKRTITDQVMKMVSGDIKPSADLAPPRGKKLEVPKMNIVIMIVGTRGDVQPFARLAQRLQKDGHRVRLATHDHFREYIVGEMNIEFFPLAGDPVVLSEYICKIQGKIIPDDWQSLKNVWQDTYEYANCVECKCELRIGLLHKIKGFRSVLKDGKCVNPKCIKHTTKPYTREEMEELDKQIKPSLISQQSATLLDIVESCWGACTKVGVKELGRCKGPPASGERPDATCGQGFHKKVGEHKHTYAMGKCENCQKVHPENRTFCDEHGNSVERYPPGSISLTTMHSNLIESESFVADAIISNPVTYGHIHCAEALGIPLHIMFPQPWLPTKAFPHPMSNGSYSQPWSSRNYVTYNVMDFIFFENLKSGLNSFRNRIGIDPLLAGGDGWHLLHSRKVPFVKMWSPWLAPKPKDWADNVDVVGTFWDGKLWDEARPPPEFGDKERLLTFLDEKVSQKEGRVNSPKPLFIGFGSMVIPDFATCIRNFVMAAKVMKLRIIFQGGWAGKMTPEQFKEEVKRASEYIDEDEDEERDGLSTTTSNAGGTAVDTSSKSGGGVFSSIKTSLFGAAAYASSSIPSFFERRADAAPKQIVETTEVDISSHQVDDWNCARDVILIGPVDHAWLFTKVCATIHHGGAGTTAQTIRAGLPTWILPFFGDQHFWGEIVHKRMLGPKPVPFADIIATKDLLVIERAYSYLLDTKTRALAVKAGRILNEEPDGVEKGYDAFYKHLPVDRMVCDVSILMGKSRLAHVYCKTCRWKLCVEVSNFIHTKKITSESHEIIPLKYCDWSQMEPRNIATGLGHLTAGTLVDLLNPNEALNGNTIRDAEKLFRELYLGIINTVPVALRGISLEKLLYLKKKAYSKHLYIPADSRSGIAFTSNNDSARGISDNSMKVGGGPRVVIGSGGGASSSIFASSRDHVDESLANALADSLFASNSSGGSGLLQGDIIIDEGGGDSDTNVKLPTPPASSSVSSSSRSQTQKRADSNESSTHLSSGENSINALTGSSDLVQDAEVLTNDDFIEGDTIEPDPTEEMDVALGLAVALRSNFDRNFFVNNEKDPLRSLEVSKFKDLLADLKNIKSIGTGGYGQKRAPLNASTNAVLTSFVEEISASNYDFVDLTKIYHLYMEYKDEDLAAQPSSKRK